MNANFYVEEGPKSQNIFCDALFKVTHCKNK